MPEVALDEVLIGTELVHRGDEMALRYPQKRVTPLKCPVISFDTSRGILSMVASMVYTVTVSQKNS